MKLWLDTHGLEKALLYNLPTGKIYKQAFIEGSNFNKIIKWLSLSFLDLTNKSNELFKGLFITESSFLLENFKIDYNIPDEIFYKCTKENRTDIYVLKYLMKGNTFWYYKAIANVYGIDVEIVDGATFYKKSMKLGNIEGNITDVITIRFVVFVDDKDAKTRTIEKIKKIYNVIKQAQTDIHYPPISYVNKKIRCDKLLPIELLEKLLFCEKENL